MNQGLLGKKLSHSYSAIIHNLFYEITGIKGNYKLYEVSSKEGISDFLQMCKNNGIYNLNVTIPYKKEVFPYLDVISSQAKKIGAINTITYKNNKFYGDNSDYFGFLKTLETKKIQIKDKNWIILGSGGSHESVKVALQDKGANEIKVVSRNKRNKMFISYEDLLKIPSNAYYGLVNTTPVGMYPNIGNCVVSEITIKKFSCAIDLIYNPLETVFLKIARNNGLETANGLFMLVAQAIKSQEIWLEKTYGAKLINDIYEKMSNKL
ncbi:MAG: shikimate dehydrogenase [Clostridiales bacterium]|nr:shikimate dehydrogenase [Clostridiales bacterium]